jgi:hypothetical protein
MLRNTKISFNVVTIDWSYGSVCHFNVQATEGSIFFVDWGNGRITEYIGQQQSIGLTHNYFPKTITPEEGMAFHVEIFSEDENCLFTSLDVSHFDMKFTDINVNQCVELEVLVCEENGLINLDLSKNTALIELRCRGNKLTSIDLRKNQALQVFDCEYNGLTCLLFGNQSNLKSVQYEEGNRIKESTKRWIEKLKCNNIL